ncbi:MAG TPA: 2-oxo acid dehydrogenase subunit E2 [Bacteroidetes bacterium]|nr:2-oxo acid dehydrogenase subunit E2 [Bacteroidota bacterium]
MVEIVRMPRLSDTMTEGVIVSWKKKIGDKVSVGDVLADVETDKATMELEAYADGVLLHIGKKAGEAVPIDVIIAIIGDKGEDIKSILDQEKETDSVKEEVVENAAKVEEEKEPVTAADVVVSESKSDIKQTKVKASPLAKKMAKEAHIDLKNVKGTGDDGRITKRDIKLFEQNGYGGSNRFSAINMEESYTDQKVSQMRKTIAKRLSESKFTAPHFYLTIKVRMDEADKLRKAIYETTEVKVSFNDLIIKAAAYALKEHPKVNTSWLGDVIRFYDHVHIGVAVAVDEGLLVPVVRFADAKPLTQISREVKDLGRKAKEKQLQPSDWEGNTFTISNLGMFGIDEFTAIVNPPDACILAVGAVAEDVISVNGVISTASMMKMTLSCDHRVVDGVTGSLFLNTVKDLLENPVKILTYGGNV